MTHIQNVLTSDEKAQLLRIYGHDLKNSANIISLNFHDASEKYPVPKSTGLHLDNLFITLDCIERLATASDFRYDCESKKLTELVEKFNKLSKLYPFEISNKFSEDKMAEIFTSGMWAVVSNLVRNAKKYGYEQDSFEQTPGLSLTLESSLFPETPYFIPEGARDHKDFIAFRIHDTGKGFPSAEIKSYQSYFTTPPEKGKKGFGLYFAGLVAKVLQAPVEIKSQPGDTTVTFYHPIYENTEEKI